MLFDVLLYSIVKPPMWFTRSRCLLKTCWFLLWYPFRYICYSSDSHRCWWC